MSNTRTRHSLNSLDDKDGGCSGKHLDHGNGDITQGKAFGPYPCQFHNFCGSLVAALCISEKSAEGTQRKDDTYLCMIRMAIGILTTPPAAIERPVEKDD